VALRTMSELDPRACSDLIGIFTDIDDTLTTDGRIVPEAFLALGRARDAGLRVIPVTGRPAGWVDHIARMWPVDAVVGENGGLWFRMAGGKMVRSFLQPPGARALNRRRLEAVAERILALVPGCALASDQPYRELDLAIDFTEDVPAMSEAEVDRIVELFHEAGAVCKVSSIHVNGWFGAFDKLTGCRRLVREAYSEDIDPARWAFFGDSANDEPMFAAFPMGIGVANVRRFLPRMKAWPAFVTDGEGGLGFAQGIDAILTRRAAATTKAPPPPRPPRRP
jgi:HAD superfamily hydrolase (TIGR01484 family)